MIRSSISVISLPSFRGAYVLGPLLLGMVLGCGQTVAPTPIEPEQPQPVNIDGLIKDVDSQLGAESPSMESFTVSISEQLGAIREAKPDKKEAVDELQKLVESLSGSGNPKPVLQQIKTKLEELK